MARYHRHGRRFSDYHLSLRGWSRDSIKRLAEVNGDIFDKTGILTLPELDVMNFAAIPAYAFDLAGRLALACHHLVVAAVARASYTKLLLPVLSKSRGRVFALSSMVRKSGWGGRRSAKRTLKPAGRATSPFPDVLRKFPCIEI